MVEWAHQRKLLLYPPTTACIMDKHLQVTRFAATQTDSVGDWAYSGGETIEAVREEFQAQQWLSTTIPFWTSRHSQNGGISLLIRSFHPTNITREKQLKTWKRRQKYMSDISRTAMVDTIKAEPLIKSHQLTYLTGKQLHQPRFITWGAP
jgi:hypothetical protein